MDQINQKNLSIIASGLLKKKDAAYVLAHLDHGHINKMVALQEKVYTNLSDENKTFVTPKNHDYFKKHLDLGHPALGIFCDGQLVAQALMILPSDKDDYTGMVDMKNLPPPEQICVLAGAIVDPDWRGNDLMKVLVNERLRVAQEKGRKYAVSEVAFDNVHSWSVLLSEGMKISSIGVDPCDSTLLYNLYGKVETLIKGKTSDAFNAVSKCLCKSSDLIKQEELLNRGYKGVAYYKETGSILYVAKKNAAAGLAK